MRKRLATGLVLAFAAGAPAAQASVISGTFLGTATSGSFITTGGSYVDVTGSPVNGSFDLASIQGARPGTIYEGPNSYLLPGGAVTLTFYIVATNTTIAPGPSGPAPNGIVLFDNGVTQSLTLESVPPDYAPNGTTLVLTGPEGSLFSDINDPTTIHAGPGVTVKSPIAVGARFVGAALVTVNSTTIAAVDEPPAWGLLAAGLTALFGVLGLARPGWRRPSA